MTNPWVDDLAFRLTDIHGLPFRRRPVQQTKQQGQCSSEGNLGSLVSRLYHHMKCSKYLLYQS